MCGKLVTCVLKELHVWLNGYICVVNGLHFW